MGFNKVYHCLLDIFPQVDQRILKAVAIENSKDVDAAAEIILSEILPYLSKKPTTSALQEQTVQLNEVSSEEESSQLRVRQSRENACSSSVSMLEEHENVPNTGLRSSPCDADLVESQISAVSKFHGKDSGKSESSVVSMSEEHENAPNTGLVISDWIVNTDESQTPTGLNFHGKDSGNNESADTDSEELASFGSSSEKGSDTDSCGANGCLNDDPNLLGQSVGLDAVTCGKSPLISAILDVETVETQTVSSAQENNPGSAKGDVCVEVGSGNNSSYHTHSEIQGVDPVDLQSQQDPVNDNEPEVDVVDTRATQICRIDILEGIIEDAKNNKKTLFQAMQSVMDLMREVELEEEAAEQAKEDAARGGLDILVELEELKQMLAHAKEANDMHAGEVYGEKAILATEVRELQSRLFSLSAERDQSLAILDEMRQTLEVQQAAAEDARKEAEQEKLKKEESARNALAQQKVIMEKVVQESMILQRKAEENSKLQEFLMDRGRIVDSLQGEISVICQDVRLLKQKFDDRVPLSKSISSSQTSCILASSGSSVKSVASEPEKISPAPSVDAQSPKGRPEDHGNGADKKELLEDGWDFFEKDAEIYS